LKPVRRSSCCHRSGFALVCVGLPDVRLRALRARFPGEVVDVPGILGPDQARERALPARTDGLRSRASSLRPLVLSGSGALFLEGETRRGGDRGMEEGGNRSPVGRGYGGWGKRPRSARKKRPQSARQTAAVEDSRLNPRLDLTRDPISSSGCRAVLLLLPG
jgi:hypothetical protein